MRLLLRVAAFLCLCAALALLLVVLTAPATFSGACYATGLALLPFGVTLGAPRARRGRLVALAGIALVAATALARLAVAARGRSLVMGAGADESSRWIDRLLDEEDLSVNAARALPWSGFGRDPDVTSLPAVMRDAYRRMREDQGAVPSPVVATYLGLEGPGASDTIVIGDVAQSAGVVIFLHGFAGSFTLPCWVVSRAAAEAAFATVCPATGWIGDWGSDAGEAILRETLARLEARGVRRVVLAGLSNGGIGASLLAPRVRGKLAGVIAISGASDRASAPGVSVLAVQGEKDAQVPASLARAYAARSGGRYVPLDAGHFALLVREESARAAMTAFLAKIASPEKGSGHGEPQTGALRDPHRSSSVSSSD